MILVPLLQQPEQAPNIPGSFLLAALQSLRVPDISAHSHNP
jgi:hypothetical protein